MANTWTGGVNDDGLRVLFDTDEAALGSGGKVVTFGPEQMIEIYWTASDFNTATDTASKVLDYNTYIPDNARLSRVEIVTVTEVDSAADNTVLNWGLVKAIDGTVIDYDGLVNSLPQASMLPAGERFVAEYDGHATYGGALMGTTITDAAKVSVYYETAAPTQGAGYIRVWYIPAVWTDGVTV